MALNGLHAHGKCWHLRIADSMELDSAQRRLLFSFCVSTILLFTL